MWLIERRSDAVFVIKDHDKVIGTITQMDEREWSIAFSGRIKLNADFRNMDMCTGYVRGIERAGVMT